tara:strand:- start:149 stop:829 length:681 start_codon:yes stop_codon:yes gene_type:complete
MFPVKKILFKLITLIFLIGCGKPSVYEAVVDGDMEAVKLHLSAGVDVDSAGVDDSHRGKTLLGLAVSNGHNEIAELLINNGAAVDKSAGPLKWAPLHFAVWKEQGDLVELLISKKANINSIDVNGSTALHFAAFDGTQEIVSLLIAKGADINAKNFIGRTPLHNAASKGPAELIELLINNGADVNALDNQGRSPVDFSFCCGGVDTDISKLLRELGGNDGVDSEGK